jgi:hypothetical protein
MKEKLNKICKTCESSYKLLYDDDEVQSLPKFCPFCGEEDYDDELDENWEEDD